MNLSKQDWNKLRYPIIFFGTALISVALVVGYAEKRRDKQQQAMTQQESQLNQAQVGPNRLKADRSGFNRRP